MTTIELAIDELVNEVAVRQDAIRALQRLRQPGLGTAPNPALQEAKPHAPAAPKSKPGRKSKMGGGDGALREPKGLTAKVLQACSEVESPFDQNTVARHIGRSVTLLQVRGALAHAAKTGRIKVIETGRPGSPGKYAVSNGAEIGRPKRVTVPGLDASEASLESKLETALKERDSAISSGHETLARILQDKVDDLQRRLDNKSKRLDGKA